MCWTIFVECSVFHCIYILFHSAMCSKHSQTVLKRTCLDQTDSHVFNAFIRYLKGAILSILIHTYICVRHLHACLSVYLCLCLFTSVFVSLPLSLCVYLCLCLSVYLCLCVFTSAFCFGSSTCNSCLVLMFFIS